MTWAAVGTAAPVSAGDADGGGERAAQAALLVDATTLAAVCSGGALRTLSRPRRVHRRRRLDLRDWGRPPPRVRPRRPPAAAEAVHRYAISADVVVARCAELLPDAAARHACAEAALSLRRGDASPLDAAGLDWGRNGTARAAADEEEAADDEDAAVAVEGADEGEAPAAVAANIGLAAAMLAFFAWRAARLLLIA